MKSIKHFFASKEKKDTPKSKQPAHIGAAEDGSYKKVTPKGNSAMATYPPRVSSLHQRNGDYSASNATTSFLPQERGREETMSFLSIGTSNALESLLTERDQAAKQVRRGPMTKGTSEVQLILNEPSCKSVEKLRNVRQRAEMTTRYGVSGTVAYNFSKSLGWNMRTSRVPSLQLKDFGTRMRQIRTASARIPAVPFSPINWLVMPTSTTRRLSYYGHRDEPEEQISEAGIWRDSNEVDITDLQPSFTYDIPLSDSVWSSATSEEEGEEGEDGEEKGEHDSDNVTVEPTILFEGEATTVEITPVSRQHIREVRV
ncbi:hypothetical protein F5B18DRAFT_676909 [Nemania serpens]|nr:hypothetical protein F5B18DRAFT_676909 [Nemania serpens]